MNKHNKLFSLFAFICISIIAYAQNSNVFPTKTINGTEYYVYTVQAGEGLYSISKRFNVSQSEINNANPQIQNGLHAGEVIIIPKKEQVVKQNNNDKEKNHTESKQTEPKTTTEYILHKVEKKQTIFAISRIYNVSQEDILAANPDAANGLHTGDMLRIPQKTNQNSDKIQQKKDKDNEKNNDKERDNNQPNKQRSENKEDKSANIKPNKPTNVGNNNSDYHTYIVQPGETLYSISRRYNTSVDEIVKLNPDVDNSLQSGYELKIPKSSNNTADNKINPANSAPAQTKLAHQKDTYKIAYLLPFMLDENSQDETIRKFLDFYMGSLLAIKNAQNSGVNYDIYTFDTEKSENKLYSVINSPEMRKMDLIIGPAYSAQIPILTDFAKRREIYTVIPFSSNVDDIEDNPYLFQFNPDKTLQSLFIADILKTRFQNSNVIVIDVDNEQTSEEKEYFDNITEKLNRSNISYVRVSKSELINNSIENYLIDYKKNVIIFTSYNYDAVRPFLTNLFDLNQKYDVGVIGQYAWKSETGKKPKMYYVAPFKSDEQRIINATNYEAEFTKYYGKLRGEKNPRYDMIGYDITNYFLSLMTKNGFDVEENTKSLKAEGIQSNMFFKRVMGKGGFMNQKLFLIENAAKRN